MTTPITVKVLDLLTPEERSHVEVVRMLFDADGVLMKIIDRLAPSPESVRVEVIPHEATVRVTCSVQGQAETAWE